MRDKKQKVSYGFESTRINCCFNCQEDKDTTLLSLVRTSKCRENDQLISGRYYVGIFCLNCWESISKILPALINKKRGTTDAK